MKCRLPVRRAILTEKPYEPPSEGRRDKIRLDFNENTAGCSPAVRRALAKLSTKHLAMYPEYGQTTRRLAKSLRLRPEELMLANGGDDALRVFFDTFVDARSTVLLCEPTFPMYRFFANVAGARIDAARYGPRMEFPIDALVQKLRQRPRVLFLANPNNPTGTLATPRELERILRAATHTAVVVDEAYSEFSGETVVPWIRKYPQLFVTRTFSKAAGLAALRLGLVIARAESLAYLRRAMPPFPVNAAVLAAVEAVLRDQRTVRAYVEEVRRLRVWLESQLTQLGVEPFPSVANFVLANFGESGPRLFQQLEKRGILVRDRSREFQPGFARITIGTEREMKRFVREVRKLWRPDRATRR